MSISCYQSFQRHGRCVLATAEQVDFDQMDLANKWQAAFHQKLPPEPLQTWLEINDLAELAEWATVDWIPAGVLLDTLAWQVAQCLTQCQLPQPIAVIR